MKPLSSAPSRLDINTDYISVGSKQHVLHKEEETKTQELVSKPQNTLRERPIIDSSDFIEFEGKKLFLSAPRGTYLDIFV